MTASWTVSSMRGCGASLPCLRNSAYQLCVFLRCQIGLEIVNKSAAGEPGVREREDTLDDQAAALGVGLRGAGESGIKEVEDALDGPTGNTVEIDQPQAA